MQLTQHIVNAFTCGPFSGNPAAVILLDHWLEDELMQCIAAQNNLAETAFLVRLGDARFHIRWFTPAVEVPLCGHATLASAFALRLLDPDLDTISFTSKSGELSVNRQGEHLTLDFPSETPRPAKTPDWFAAGFGANPLEFHTGSYCLAVVSNQAILEAIDPDFAVLRSVPKSNTIITAPGDDCDFVSRFFAPRDGIDEDPVTGSAHCLLTPYWARRLGKSELTARQLSQRGGALKCIHQGDRALIQGKAELFSVSTLYL